VPLQADPSALRWLVLTGEALAPELCRRWLRAYPGIPLFNAYGPTECSDDVTHYPITCPLDEDALHTPIGRPVANMQIYILDDQLQPVPIAVAGAIYVGGIGVGRGYRNRPELTAAAFIPNPFAGVVGDGCWVSEDSAPNTQHLTPNTRLYKTGDLG